ncbi:MAG: MobC family plasmid mobilization relaxosome protein, partial [Pseudomonadota bacterium]|nr:MobC family plasmid mobilization relaxosome protein [Pseudomonadota bacterium]
MENQQPKKSAEIKIRCTDDFKKYVKNLSAKHDLPMTKIVELGFRKFDEKYQCATAKPKKVIHQADPVLIRELSKIGNNINQLARAVNI